MTQLPDGYTMRRPTLDNAPAIADAYHANDVYFECKHEINAVEMAQYMKEADLENNAWVIFAPDGTVAGYEDLHVDTNKARFDIDGVVHPAHFGRGIGSFLLYTVESRITDILTEIDLNGKTPVVFVTINGQDPIAKELFATYEIEKSDVSMEIQLEEAPPEPTWADGITLRTFKPGEDDHDVWQVVDRAFQSISGEHDVPFERWQNYNINRDAFDPTLWFLAMDGSTIAGVCLCPHDKNYGWVRQLAVLPEYRGKGIGVSLMRHALCEWFGRGEKRVGLGVQSDNIPAISLYKKLGFEVESVYDTYRKTLA